MDDYVHSLSTITDENDTLMQPKNSCNEEVSNSPNSYHVVLKCWNEFQVKIYINQKLSLTS